MVEVTRLTHRVLRSARSELEARGYTEVVVPRIVRASGACENIDTLFEVAVDANLKWFNDRRSYLGQTGQLYLEALVPKLGKTYCVGSSFRAEPRVDGRHLTEFQLLEIEFAGGFDQLLREIEAVVRRVASDVVAAGEPSSLGLTVGDLERLARVPARFPELTYDEAVAVLQKLGESMMWGDDISSAREQLLVRFVGDVPLFITRFPDPMWDFGKPIEVEKFFNMLPDTDHPGRVLSCDLILPIAGESVGAAARVHEPDVLVRRLTGSRMLKRLREKGGDLSDFSWYVEQVKRESVPHAGCGFGMARIVQWIRGTDDIRQAVPFVSNREALV